MKQLFILAGVAALAVTAPAYAKPGNGHGNGNGHENGRENDNGDRNGYGDRDGNRYGYAESHRNYGYGEGNCPHGLAKKHNGCMPPGQYRKRFAEGQRFSSSYGRRYAYSQLPYNLRSQYDLTRADRYYYDNGYLYQVDPRTMVVEQVIQTLLGRR